MQNGRDNDRMTRFMVCSDFFFFLGKQVTLSLGAKHNFLDCPDEIELEYLLSILSCCQDGAFVHERV